MLKKLRTYLTNKIVQILFNKYYSGYIYPFANADYRIAQMLPTTRNEYYRQIKECIIDDNGQLKGFMLIEIDEWVRHFTKKLANETSTVEEMTAYRVNLIFCQQLEKRLKYLASKYK